MKALNTMKFVTNATVELTKYQNAIREAETYDIARNAAYQMRGYIDCMITFLNTMICMENNDFTGDFGDVLDDWMVTLYQTLADKAIETKQDGETIHKLLCMRDEHTEQ